MKAGKYWWSIHGELGMNIFSSQLSSSSASSLLCALVPYLYMIYKSFILNLNLIDLADLRMHPLLGVCPVWRCCVWGEEIERQTAGYRQGNLRGGPLACQRSNLCQVGSEASWAASAHALCSSTQLPSVIRSGCKGGGSAGWGLGAQAVLIERSVLVCRFGGKWRGRGWGIVGAWGHMVRLPEEKGSFPCNTCQVSHKRVTCLTSLLRGNI